MATKSRREDALAVERPEGFFKRERMVQRVGIAFLTLFVLAGAVGLFGDGLLSDATVRSGTVTVSYERFTRQTYRTELAVDAETTSDANVEIRINREFLTNIDVLDVRPMGALRRLDQDVAIFEVPSVAGKAFLQLQYEPKTYGVLQTAVAVGTGAAHVRQIVFF